MEATFYPGCRDTWECFWHLQVPYIAVLQSVTLTLSTTLVYLLTPAHPLTISLIPLTLSCLLLLVTRLTVTHSLPLSSGFRLKGRDVHSAGIATHFVAKDKVSIQLSIATICIIKSVVNLHLKDNNVKSVL